MGESAVRRVNTGGSAFEGLYRRHGPEVLAFFLRRLPRAEAHDAAADVFEIAWRRFDDVPGDDEAVRWLFGVARNVLANRRRGIRRRDRLGARLGTLGDAPADGPEVQVLRQEQDQAVIAAVMSLPEKYRDPLLLVEWEGLDREDVATIHGISRNAVDQRLSRAYKRLARVLAARRTITDHGRRSPLDTEKGADE
jgi:RNA polymerase sigma factor (sigma-70 family)